MLTVREAARLRSKHQVAMKKMYEIYEQMKADPNTKQVAGLYYEHMSEAQETFRTMMRMVER